MFAMYWFDFVDSISRDHIGTRLLFSAQATATTPFLWARVSSQTNAWSGVRLRAPLNRYPQTPDRRTELVRRRRRRLRLTNLLELKTKQLRKVGGVWKWETLDFQFHRWRNWASATRLSFSLLSSLARYLYLGFDFHVFSERKLSNLYARIGIYIYIYMIQVCNVKLTL